jgi:4-amino-4-deoxychorismate lyase
LKGHTINQGTLRIVSCSIHHAKMKVYQSKIDYSYTFPAVTLAYFLRYPNPYSRHVLSTDVIERYIDPDTKRLHTTRLHLKKSKVPAGILSFLPKGLSGPGGSSQSFVLEKSTIDVREGWMKTESKNMEWTGILSVVEQQEYRRHPVRADTWSDKTIVTDSEKAPRQPIQEWTSCKTTVTFVSKLGQAKALRKKADAFSHGEDDAPKQGLFASWGTAGIQRTVELIGVKRTTAAVVNGAKGMNVVLERLRHGGLVGVLEGMRQDRLEAFGPDGPWKQTMAGISEPERADRH